MIRIQPNARREAWHDIEINLDGETAPMRVRYWLLPRAEAGALNHKRYQVQAAVTKNADDADEKALKEKALVVIDYLLNQYSPEQMAAAEALLRKHILDWDLQDADSPEGAKLPVNEQTLNAILDQARFFEPLYLGLIDASLSAAKKTGSTGSAGGSTTSSHG